MNVVEEGITFESNDIKENWAYQLSELGYPEEKGLSGKGAYVVVIDPNIEKKKTQDPVFRHTYDSNEPTRREHGYKIGKIIKTLLPDAKVELVGIGDGTTGEVPYQIIEAVKRGASVINLSFGLESEYSTTDRDIYFRRIVNQAVKGEESPSFNADVKNLDEAQGQLNTLQMAKLQIAHALDFAEENGVTVIAASGYGFLDTDATSARYPNVIMVGGINSDGSCVDTPTNARVDIYAPGDDMTVNPDFKRTKDHASHSFAAPIVSAAAAIAGGIYNKNLHKTKEVVLSATQKTNGLNVINYRVLTNHLLQVPKV